MAILYSFVVIAVLGLVLGIGLSIADKKLKVEKDSKLLDLEAAMPGANCGGCGYAGCAAYAEAVFNGSAPAGLCAPGGAALAARMGEILGIEVEVKEREVAYVHCKGNPGITMQEYEYKGISDCNAAALLLGGPNACKEGCLHLGSCIAVCPVGAISRDADGNVVVDKEKCIGCKKCTTVCPNGVIKMIPYSAKYVVACNNHENGARVRAVCQAGCIGCKICQVKVPGSPFMVENFLSRVDYSKSQENVEQVLELCPRKCIEKR